MSDVKDKTKTSRVEKLVKEEHLKHLLKPTEGHVCGPSCPVCGGAGGCRLGCGCGCGPACWNR